MPIRILAIETSCDETSIAIAKISGSRNHPRISVLSHIISSQVKLHQKFGGVVPNLARREHEKNLVPILLRALKEADFSNKELGITNRETKQRIRNSQFPIPNSILEREPELLKRFTAKIVPLSVPQIDAIAVTYGPGLAPALWVGVNFAHALAVLWDKPLIPINHMMGHFFSAFLQKSGKEKSQFAIRNSQFPKIALLVSGGHTELVLVRKPWKFEIVGETRDDAAGEAFDKVARILGLGYPGGPFISAAAEMKLKVKSEKLKIKLPRPMIGSNDYDFSFSGLKTAVLYLTRELGAKQTKKLRPLIAKEFQDAVVDVLVKKTIRAAKEYKAKAILLGGGVAANNRLRASLGNALRKEIPDSQFLIPDISLTGDNALMIALAAHFQWASLAIEKRAAYFTGKPGSNSSAAASGSKTQSGRRLLPGNKKAWSKVHADANVRLTDY